MQLNPDNTFRRLVNDGPRRCNCGAMAMIFVQTMGTVGDCMACGIAAGIVSNKSIDVNSRRYPRPDQARAPRNGKGQEMAMWTTNACVNVDNESAPAMLAHPGA